MNVRSQADMAEIQFCMWLDERYCEDVAQAFESIYGEPLVATHHENGDGV